MTGEGHERPSSPPRTDEGAAPASRRSFLNAMLGLGGLGWAGVIAYPVLTYLNPDSAAPDADEVTLGDGDVKQLTAAGYVIVRLGSDRVLVLRGRDGGLRALNAACTHEGCTVQYRSDQDVVWCACHNARFDLAGRVVSGPPPRPLPLFKVAEAKVGDAVQVTVSRA